MLPDPATPLRCAQDDEKEVACYAQLTQGLSNTFSLSGTHATNYALTPPTVTATINPRSISGAVVNITGSYTYNGPANGQTLEYAISLTDSALNSGWQSQLTFSGLSEDTQYYLFARSADNTNYEPGTSSAALPARTDPSPPSGAPLGGSVYPTTLTSTDPSTPGNVCGTLLRLTQRGSDNYYH